MCTRTTIATLVVAMAGCSFNSNGGTGDGPIVGDTDAREGVVDAAPGEIDAADIDAGTVVIERKVLLLGDHPANSNKPDGALQIQAALEAADVTVTYAGLYPNWDVSSTVLANYQVVIWMQGETWNVGFADPNAQSALVAYVNAGGVLLRTEWSTWEAYASSSKTPVVDQLLPVDEYSGYVAANNQWAATAAAHPYLAAIDFPFDSTGSYTKVSAKAGATVVANQSASSGFPALVTMSVGNGQVVQLNHDLTWRNKPIQTEILQMIVNVGKFAPAN